MAKGEQRSNKEKKKPKKEKPKGEVAKSPFAPQVSHGSDKKAKARDG